VPAFKPTYLIHGDDHARVAERRARLRALADADPGAGGAEVFEGDAVTPDLVANALCAMTFATGRRFLIVDGVERWKDKEVAERLAAVLRDLPAETTVAFFAREEGRAKAPAALREAVRAGGGDIALESTVKPWELAGWVREQGRRVGLELDSNAARALVTHVGERQARLARELETLVLEHGVGARLGAEEIDERAARSAQRKVWVLADLLVAGDSAAATRCYLDLRAQGERLPGMLYWMAKRMRDAVDVASRLEAGESPNEIKRSLRMPPKPADRFMADVRRGGDAASLRRALADLADLELDSRGGADLDEDTSALRAITQIAA